MSDDKNKKGFAGLSSLASNVSSVTRSVPPRPNQTPKRAAEPKGQDSAVAPSRSATKRTVRQRPRAPGSGSARPPGSGAFNARWIWVVVGGVGLLIGLIHDAQQSGSGGRRFYTEPSVAPTHTPAPAQTNLTFSKPPVGTDILLSVAQIRWCLREDIHIDVLRPMATSNAQIVQFNAIVSDYNGRCGSFRYRDGALERARREVNAQRARIIATISPPWHGANSSTNASRNVVSRLTLDVQNNLKALGYDPGPVDGIYGAKTRSAIEAFQREQGVSADGKVSEALLQRLRQSLAWARRDNR